MSTTRGPVTTSSSGSASSDVLELADVGSQETEAAGSKAAALAKAAAAGLSVLDGFVVTTRTRIIDEDAIPSSVREAWHRLSADGTRPLVVRSSSAIEDTGTSSMAGQFTTVVDVRGWTAFVDALLSVARSAGTVARTRGIPEGDVPMAILVQPLILPRIGGVMFGIDPVTGRSDRRVIATVHGLPEQLVSGVAAGSRYETDASGRTKIFEPGPDDVRVPRRIRRRLIALADRCAEVFGGPQDIEWAVDADGKLWLLQSRPVTTTVAGIPQGPVLGPGPVGETFPDPLSRLEQDLWVEPLRDALHSVFAVLGVLSRRHLARSPFVVVVDGRVAVDLDLLEAGGQARWYDIARRARALRGAWRMGRLRAALVPIADDVVAAADAALLAVPAVGELTDRQLVAGLERFREALRSLHGYEMLVGLVLHPGEARLTASSVALRVLAAGRAEGIADADLPARYPVVVALTAPHVGPDIELPRRLSLPEWTPGDEDPAGVVREALRLRVRWVQEAGARYAWELGERLAAAGALADPGEVLDLELEALEMTVRGLAVPVPGASPRPPRRDEPLPARFRLSDRGIPIPVLDRHPHQGTGAGGGRGRGPVHVGTGGDGREVPDGVVLVVPTLDARLAPALGRINGLVSETGSVLAHLSILARESGVPVVVGLEGATGRFPEGTEVSVDGTTGAVTRLDAGPDARRDARPQARPDARREADAPAANTTGGAP